MRLILAGFALACLIAQANAAEPNSGDAREKWLIEFGWDEPDTAFLRRHLDAMEATPFDGCVFHAVARKPGAPPVDFAWKSWGRRAFTREELATAFEDLKATRVGRFRRNFLRFNTTPADLDWFDDHLAVVGNAKLAAELARAGPCGGILLDTEAYEGKLFDYKSRPLARSKSWDEYATQARKRGREVMQAFQEGYPGLTVLLTFGPSVVAKQAAAGKEPKEALPDSLLTPFVEGMAEVLRGDARLIDGHEPSYGYRDPARFAPALEAIRKAGGVKVEAGFGLWLDYDWPKYGWNLDDPSRNYFTPDALEASLREAFARSDGVVWLYSETPRWWTAEGRASKLPTAYVEAIRRARR